MYKYRKYLIIFKSALFSFFLDFYVENKRNDQQDRHRSKRH